MTLIASSESNPWTSWIVFLSLLAIAVLIEGVAWVHKKTKTRNSGDKQLPLHYDITKVGSKRRHGSSGGRS